MKQIKTIIDKSASAFDKEVNQALREGWELVKRYCEGYGFIAELEREEITEDERTCENCKHSTSSAAVEPCLSCDEKCSKWEDPDA